MAERDIVTRPGNVVIHLGEQQMNRKLLKITTALTALGLGAAAVVVGTAGTAAATPSAPDISVHGIVASLGIGRPNPYRYLPKVPSFQLTSQTVKDGRPLPKPQFSGVFGAGGQDISPQLSWSDFPKNTKSFTVSMYDPEAPTGSGFLHWLVSDIPGTTTSLPVNAGALSSTTLPAGAFQLNADSGMPRYIGAAPPAKSGEHDYFITVTALDVPKTGLTATTSGALFAFSTDSHVVGRATLVCPTWG
jgi:Raf kinase inhibitor-like YbhB/YbcL family protein